MPHQLAEDAKEGAAKGEPARAGGERREFYKNIVLETRVELNRTFSTYACNTFAKHLLTELQNMGINAWIVKKDLAVWGGSHYFVETEDGYILDGAIYTAVGYDVFVGKPVNASDFLENEETVIVARTDSAAAQKYYFNIGTGTWSNLSDGAQTTKEIILVVTDDEQYNSRVDRQTVENVNIISVLLSLDKPYEEQIRQAKNKYKPSRIYAHLVHREADLQGIGMPVTPVESIDRQTSDPAETLLISM